MLFVFLRCVLSSAFLISKYIGGKGIPLEPRYAEHIIVSYELMLLEITKCYEMVGYSLYSFPAFYLLHF